MPARIKRSVPELWVVFDTNAVYTGSASYLLRKEVVDTITENSGHPDLQIRWILPAVVRHERQYQMIRQAQSFLPTVQKLEKLLGNSLNIAPDVLELRVREAAHRSILELGLEIEELDVNAPDWQRIILDAVYRRPPFDGGDTEKGFRDSIVLETFIQLTARAPQNPKSCRLALVSGDKLLSEAVNSRTSNASNVRLFASVEELRGLINTLVSQVDEEFVRGITPSASKLFFVHRDQETLYYVAKVRNEIDGRIKADLGPLPPGSESFRAAKYVIAAPQFVRKDRQRIHWSSRIEISIEGMSARPIDFTSSPWDLGTPIKNLGFGSIVTSPSGLLHESVFDSPTNIWLPAPKSFQGSESFLPIASAQTVANGKVSYDVFWSTVISTARRLTRPRVDSIAFVEAVWGTK